MTSTFITKCIFYSQVNINFIKRKCVFLSVGCVCSSQQHQLSQPNMETAENDNTDDICVNGYDSDGVPAYPCSTERWAPLGAAAVSPTPSNELR